MAESKNSPLRPTIENVAFLNAINSNSPYGATLAERYLQQLDANGISMFPGQPNGIYYPAGFTCPSGYVANSAETSGVVKPTEPSLAASTVYGFTLKQVNPFTGTTYQQDILFNTGIDPANLVQGAAAAAWEANIKSLAPSGFFIASYAIAAGVLTITAASGYPDLEVVGLIGGVTLGVGTTGVYGVGNVNDMTALNQTGQPWSEYPGYSAAIAATGYDYVELDYTDPNTGQPYKTYMWINANDASYAAWKAIFYTQYLQGTIGAVAATISAFLKAALGVSA